MVAHAHKPSTWDAEMGGSQVQDQPGLESEFRASLDYVAKP